MRGLTGDARRLITDGTANPCRREARDERDDRDERDEPIEPSRHAHNSCTSGRKACSIASGPAHRATRSEIEHPMRAFIAFVLFLIVAGTAGGIGYQAGVASTVGDAGRVVILGGFPSIGSVLFLFFLFGLVLLAFRPRRHGPWGRHGMMGGPGGWGGGWSGGPMGNPGDPRRQWVAEAHRRLHEEEARSAASTPPSGPTSTGNPSPGSTGDRPTAG
jgi:hypothetical protein